MSSRNTGFARTMALVIAGSWLLAGPAVANDKGKAKVLMNQADQALKDGGSFQDAWAKYDQALKLDPSPENALRACQKMYSARDDDLKWALSSGAMWVAMARCDYAAYGPNSTDEQRRVAHMKGDDLRSSLRFEGDKAENDKRRVAAAKALYGVGLTMKYDKKSNKISLDYGSVDAKTLQGFIAQFYAGYAFKIGTNSGRRLPMVYLNEGKKNEYMAGRETGRYGWVLLEPMAKYALCNAIAYDMNQGSRDLEDWCKVQAAIEANSPLFAFTGSPVDWDAGKLEGGGLTPDAPIFLPSIDGKYPVAITIAGPKPVDDYQHIHFLKAMAYQLKSHDPEVLGLVARAEKLEKKRQAKWLKLDAKLGGRKGKVVFAQQTFQSWDIPKLLGGKDSVPCDTLYYKAYAPKGSKSYDAAFAVDGTTCNVLSVWSNAQTNAVTDSLRYPFAAKDDKCPDALAVPGEHKIVITMHEVKAAKTGNRLIKVSGDHLKLEDEYMGVWGRKVGTWKTSCTTEGKRATDRFQ